ncbi:MAG: carboxypeptidase-like regulatory domain-containing protein, partial [Bacteroidota bacterium]|nr:carboxypeptidase-like regulatory domain-containing protein [Bacteroidota bacterium]
NQTYSYQLQSYNLMNFLEFVSDEYVSMNVTHNFYGFFFNKIPLFKKLKLREVASCKILYGMITDRNNPDLNTGLFKLPVSNSGVPITYTLDTRPYIEVSAGIANIFKLIRVDIVKRLTYNDHPNVANIGIRTRFKIDF